MLNTHHPMHTPISSNIIECQDTFGQHLHDIRNHISTMKLNLYLMERESSELVQTRTESIREQIAALTEVLKALEEMHPCEVQG